MGSGTGSDMGGGRSKAEASRKQAGRLGSNVLLADTSDVDCSWLRELFRPQRITNAGFGVEIPANRQWYVQNDGGPRVLYLRVPRQAG